MVGETAALDFSTGQMRPLAGVSVALTGTPVMQARLRRPLLELGARPFSLMTTLVEERQVDFDWSSLSTGPNWVVLTSQNGVECFFRALDGAGVDLRSLAPCRFAVIGPATGEALRRHGIVADLCPEVHTTRGLAQALLETVSPGQPVRLFRSRLGSRALYQALAGRFPVEDIPLYDLRPSETGRAALQEGLERADYLLFSSASGVEFLLDTGVTLPAALTCVCIGPVTARALAARSAAPFLTASGISAESAVQAVRDHRCAASGR